MISPYKRDFILQKIRLGGSLKIDVSFAKEPYKRDCILHKMIAHKIHHTMIAYQISFCGVRLS